MQKEIQYNIADPFAKFSAQKICVRCIMLIPSYGTFYLTYITEGLLHLL